MKKYTIVWSLQARTSLKEIHEFVNLNSASGALKVISKIFDTGEKLKHFPNGHPVDTRLMNESVVYRFIPIWSYQIIFTVDEKKDRVIIVQVFDSRQNPDKLKV